MIEVVDMIFERGRSQRPSQVTAADLEVVTDDAYDEMVKFIDQEHSKFLKYYRSPKQGSASFAVRNQSDIVGAVLLEELPEAAESDRDAALACVVVATAHRNKGLGSSIVVAACDELLGRGFDRVIAEWVASVPLYQRLGFHVWRTRQLDESA